MAAVTQFKPFAALVILVAAVAPGCRSRGTQPPPPRVEPTRAALVASRDAGTTGAPRAAPPPAPVEGPVALAWAGGRAVPGVTGRIDALRITALGARARVVVNYVTHEGGGAADDDGEDTGRDVRHTLGVDLDPDAASISAPRDTLPDGGAAAAPPLGAPVVATAGATRIATLTAAPNEFNLVGADPAPRLPETYLPDELAASDDGSGGFIAAAVGTELECGSSDGTCSDGRSYRVMRSMVSDYHDGRQAFSVLVLARGPAGLVATSFARVPCARPTESWRSDGSGVIDEIPEVIPDTRCRGARSRRPDDVAVAYHPRGSAVAWRAAHALYVVRVTPLGAAQGEPAVLARGDVGAPALAWRGDTLLAVWAQRPRAGAPYALNFVEWTDPGAAGSAAPAPQVLPTGTAPAFAPALAAVGPRTVLAWTEGSDRTASVHVGASLAGLAHVTEHAVAISSPDRNARDPELAWREGSPAAGWLVWSERPAGQSGSGSDGEVRVSPLRAP